LHCPHCHGWEVRDRRIGVLATGPAGVRHALNWRQWSPNLLLVLHDVAAPDQDEMESLQARGIGVVDGPVSRLMVEGDRLTGALLASGDVVALDALVVTPRFTARAAVLTSLGLSPVDVGFGEYAVGSQIPADPTGATDVPGVWVAGNVAHMLAQVVTAAATGLNAAVAINADLATEDTRAAVDAYRRRTGTFTGTDEGGS
jgi:thioredoxin reductase